MTKKAVLILMLSYCCSVFGGGGRGVVDDTFITGLTADSITVTTGKDSRTYLVGVSTEIVWNGQHATLADLRKGMRATVVAGTDPTKASRIRATGPKRDG